MRSAAELKSRRWAFHHNQPQKLRRILEEEGSKTHVSSSERLGFRTLQGLYIYTIKRKCSDKNGAFYLQKV